jgi:hypothetical protein
MKLFGCTCCSNLVYFENRKCESCGSQLGYLPEPSGIYALEAAGDNWLALKGPPGELRFCANQNQDACNWLIPAESGDTLCAACRHNRVIPDLSIPENLRDWRTLEYAKHHVFYGLLRLGLPLETRQEQPEYGLAFDFLADGPDGHVLTGHDNGIITLNLAEADDAIREKRRTELGEPFRTLIGHFRHEIGHYFWDRLVRDRGGFDAFREEFGDERQDYGEALKTYYAEGAPANWRENFISAYACSHPWEDFAETWAHFLHIVDALEMAASFGLRVNPGVTKDPSYSTKSSLDPYAASSIDGLVRRWLPITAAVNSINRCMGQPDLYPFVLTPAIIRKLGFIHNLIRGKS